MSRLDPSAEVLDVLRSDTDRAYAIEELVGELAARGMDLTQERMQNILGVLESWGRIEARRSNRKVYYVYCDTTAFSRPRGGGSGYIVAAARRVRAGIKGIGAAKVSRSEGTVEKSEAVKVATPTSAAGESILSDIENRNFVKTILEGLLNYPQLLSEGIRPLFSDPEIAEKLDEAVNRDLSESLRCLAFNICTAGTMCSLKAVEGALGGLYKALSGQKTGLAWGPLVEEIERLLQENGISSPELLGYLSYIKNIRSAAEHPDRTFDKSEAEHTLVNSANVIEEVYRLMGTLGKKR